MRSSKPQPRLIQNPEHLIWVKYFEKQSKIPSLPRGSSQDLISIYNELIHPHVLKSEIYAPPDKKNADNEKFLLELFELQNPITQNEIKLIQYVRNHQEILSKPFKILKVIGPSIMRIIIRFYTLFRSYLLTEQYDKISLNVFKEDAISIFWITLHLPKPFKNDARIVCCRFFKTLPNPDNKYNLVLSLDYFRELECQCFQETLLKIKYNKTMKPFYIYAMGFLMRYVQVIADSLGKNLISKNELENCKQFLTKLQDSSQEFMSSIPPQLKTSFIHSLLYMLTNLQHYSSSTHDIMMIYDIALLAYIVVTNLINNDANLIPSC